MAYFLKKTKNKKGLYLQIYESHWDPARRHTVHKSIRPIGYEHELIESGIENPIEHFKAEIDEMNKLRKEEKNTSKTRKIGDVTPECFLGHFPLRSINEQLGVDKDISYLELVGGFKFNLYDLLSDLIYARAVLPCSKRKTYTEVLPQLASSNKKYSLDQLYDAVCFLGQEYQKVIEIYNAHIADMFVRDTSKTFFDCTNFFFEIDREDTLRKKGPSKENRKSPIVGMGLLLDASCIPLGMAIYPGNESEKPVLREVISQVKRRHNMSGRTVRVADKGLNCADNIADAILAQDGYIFSKSIKQLSKKDQVWALSEEGFSKVIGKDGEIAYKVKSFVADFDYMVTNIHGKKEKVTIPEKRVVTYNPYLARKQKAEINRQVEKARNLRMSNAKRVEYGDSAKFVTFITTDKNGKKQDGKVIAMLNHEAIERARNLAGYNMIVTSEINMTDSEIYSTYHELWRIEESFKAMKSQLDARPVYLQKPDSIKGHFLICYISVLLERLFQVKVLDNNFSTEEIMNFIKKFKAVEVSDKKYINITKASSFIDKLEALTNLPLSNYYLSKSQVKEILNAKVKIKTN